MMANLSIELLLLVWKLVRDPTRDLVRHLEQCGRSAQVEGGWCGVSSSAVGAPGMLNQKNCANWRVQRLVWVCTQVVVVMV